MKSPDEIASAIVSDFRPCIYSWYGDGPDHETAWELEDDIARAIRDERHFGELELAVVSAAIAFHNARLLGRTPSDLVDTEVALRLACEALQADGVAE